LRCGCDLSSLRTGVDAADEIGPFVPGGKRDGAWPLAHGKTLDRPHLDFARAGVPQVIFDGHSQLTARLFEIALIAVDGNPACNANENCGSRAAHGFPASAGMRLNMAVSSESED